MKITEKETHAMIKLLDIAGLEADAMQRLVKDGSLTINAARNGRDVAWLLLENQNMAIYVDDLQALSEEEIESELM